MFNELLTKPKQSIGFNPIIPKYSESKTKYLYANGIQIESLTGDASFTSDSILFQASTTSKVARTTNAINILGYDKAWIVWDCSQIGGGAFRFSIVDSYAGDTFYVERVSAFSKRYDYIDIAKNLNTLKGYQNYPNFTININAYSDGVNTLVSRAYVVFLM